MKNFFEKTKDMLYDSVDYIIMISIIGIVALIIGWRLDLLFADNKLNEKTNTSSLAMKNEVQENSDPKSQTSNDSNPSNNDNIPLESQDGEIIAVNIPEGSLPSMIGTILENEGLVKQSDFIQKVQELKLDTNLKSGDYEIEKGTPVEDIVKIIADKK